MTKYIALLNTIASVLLFVFSVPALANTVNPNSNSTYPNEFFEQYQPQNAFDMIERLPGFTFERDSNARGFGGNAGNVLIDGVRPTSKGGGLAGALKRIPTKQVLKIEIYRGGTGVGDAAGKSIIANVIKRKNITTGTYAIKFRQTLHGGLQPNVELGINTTLGEWESAFDTDIGFNPGYRDAIINTYDSNDALANSASETRETLSRYFFSNGQMARDFDAGKLTINGRFGVNRWNNDQRQNIFNDKLADDNSASLPNSQWMIDEVSRFKTAEIGVDWVKNFGDWKWHSLGLAQIEDRKYNNKANTKEQEQITDFNSYGSDRYKSEYIYRNSYGYTGKNSFKPEWGIEIARNFLDTKLESSSNGVAEIIDNSDVEIEEIRAELFARFNYQYSDIWSFDGGLTGEISQIKVDGDDVKEQNLTFLKPRLAANYKINQKTNLAIEAVHVVQQLNFNDFAASSSTIDDRSVSGNSELQPEQSSELSLRLDWTFSEKGSLKLKAFHHWRDDILEEIKLSEVDQGLGNAGSAKFWGFDTDIIIPIDQFLNNGLIEISYKYRDSEFNDSIINRTRKISDYDPKRLNIELRQDIIESKFTWGIEYDSDSVNIDYLVDEIERFEANKRLKMYVESSYFDGYKIQLEVSNLNVGKFKRTREFFAPDRGGQYDGAEISDRRRSPFYKLSIWGTF